MFFLINSLFILSPDSIAKTDDEIVIIFEEHFNEEEFKILLDGYEIKGELKEDYFYYKPEYLFENGRHNLCIIIGIDTTIFEFNVLDEEENVYQSILNIGFGYLYNTYVDTSIYPLYKEGKFFIFNVDFDIYKNNLNMRGNIVKDPDYYYSIYGLLTLEYKFSSFNIGFISPFFDEITLSTLQGLGFLSDIKIKNSTLKSFYLYSYEKDTLISEYKRILYGINCDVESIINLTIMKGYDDTIHIQGIPVFFPQKATLLSCNIGFGKKIKPYLILAYSSGSFNTFDTISSSGFCYEIGLKNKQISIHYRFADTSYISIGNPFLEKGGDFSLKCDFKINRFTPSLDFELSHNFYELNISRAKGIFDITSDLNPFRFNISFSHIENFEWRNRSSCITFTSYYIKNTFTTSLNITHSIIDTLKNTYFSTNSSFAIGTSFIDINLYFSQKKLKYNFEFFLNLLKFGFNFNIKGFFDEGKHQESYKGNISRFF